MYERPLEATLLLTHQCNLYCRHCWGDFGKALPTEISTIEWIDIFNELDESGILYVSLNGGEPFCRPDIEQLMHHLEELELHYMIFTNGLLITEHVAKKLAQLDFLTQIRLSIDGASSRSHEALRIFPDEHSHQAFTRAVRTMELLQKNEVNFTVNTVLFKDNMKELKRMSSLLEKYGAKEWYIDNLGNLGRALLCYEELHVPSVHSSTFQSLSDSAFPINFPPETPIYKGDCTAGRNKVTVDADGAVMWCPLCVKIDFPFTNIREVPLLEQWKGEQFELIRHYVETPSGFCAQCRYHNSCDGCPVISYLYFSRFDLPPPDCFFKLNILGLENAVGDPKPYIELIKRREDDFKRRLSDL